MQVNCYFCAGGKQGPWAYLLYIFSTGFTKRVNKKDYPSIAQFTLFLLIVATCHSRYSQLSSGQGSSIGMPFSIFPGIKMHRHVQRVKLEHCGFLPATCLPRILQQALQGDREKWSKAVHQHDVVTAAAQEAALHTHNGK